MPVVTFDGPNKVITEIAAGSLNEITAAEIYSDWKRWVAEADNAKFAFAFTPVGGDPITASQSLGVTLFLENGWRIRPAELDHKLSVVGNLYTRESGQSAFLPTLGAFTVLVETRVSSIIDQVATGGAAAGLTVSQEAALLETRDHARAANAQTQKSS